ncbi:MAG: hypothetical protein PHG85_04175 [Candidatus Altiarchaeota archaeon]|nr:hypothetical protein [Candidatus Altiarchaeota archaeon]
MAPVLGYGEDLLLTFTVAYNPGFLKPNKRTAYLTNSRLILQAKPYVSIPFSSITGLKLSDWGDKVKMIEMYYGQKAKFYVVHAGRSNNEKTGLLFGWLREAQGKPEMPKGVVYEVKHASNDFYNKYSVFGHGFDMSNRYAYLAVGIFVIGKALGGDIGGGIALSVSEFIMGVGSSTDISPAKRGALIVVVITLGIIVALIIAEIIRIWFYLGRIVMKIVFQYLEEVVPKIVFKLYDMWVN